MFVDSPTLNAFGEISEVEDVVRFSRGREKIGRHPAVYLHRGLTDWLRCLTHSLGKVHEKSSKDLLQFKIDVITNLANRDQKRKYSKCIIFGVYII